MKVNRHTLPNGLRLVHSYDPYTAMAAVNVLYDVGTRDESRHRTGMAHLFEHLMFGGSVHVPDFDGVLENAGGRSNAWTSSDFTNFYDTLPATNLDTALYLESDRMLGLAFSERALEVQRGVVIEEFKQQCLDRPYGDLFHHLRRIAYAEEHPYSWPTIGLRPEHIAEVTQDDVREWFYRHYAPDNAVLAITGNVDFDTACRSAERWFADVPARNVAARRLPDPGFPDSDVELTVEGAVPYPLIVQAYPMAAYGEPDYFAADTITDILSVGRAARLRTNVVDGRGHGIVSDADASIIGSEGPGLLLVTARVASNDDADIKRAVELLREEARSLAEPGSLSAHELERTVNTFESTFRFSNIGYLALASNLAQAELHGEDINRTVDDRRRLTVADITDAAQRIFSTPSATIIYRPHHD
ncbi:MAG: insulinase family protein [Muribaculaceae bacterium]|nr:insulinase family protein [Muribaculaceae bacterium]